MNTLSSLQTQLDSYLGYSEQVRLTPEQRLAAINESLKIVYGLLAGTNLLKKTGTITATSGVATPPTDFNEGSVLYLGDSSTFENSSEILEVDEQDYARLADGSADIFVQRYNSSTGDLEFLFTGVSDGTFYIEYEKGAPTLASTNDFDGLPTLVGTAVAKLAAGILTDNVLSDSSKMQLMLYGPTGSPGKTTPDSVMGIINRSIKKRRIRRQDGRMNKITII